MKAGNWERKELFITVSIILLSLSFFYFLAFRPRIKEISKTKQALQNIQARLEKASLAIPKVDKYEKESSVIELKMVAIRARIPREQQIPQLLDELRRLAKEAKIDELSLSTEKEQLISFQDEKTESAPPDMNPPAPDRASPPASPGELSKEGSALNKSEVKRKTSFNCYRIPITVKAKGKYQSLAKFLEEIPRSNRLFTVNSLNLQRVEETIPLIKAIIHVNAYYLRPQSQEKTKESLRR
ncbi:MAG: type 4a pilus biogenesis protein PilO [Nitrospirae bacterium]|nr:type 4a pilus biogenesis protein PilO [Nitrospirota bacterium]